MLNQSEKTCIKKTVSVFKTPWFEVFSKVLDNPSLREDAPYYTVKPRDYVSLIALTPNSEIILVRQYRPAVEEITLELPSGLLESEEDPYVTAIRELREETGYVVPEVKLMGTLLPDSGRLENRNFCYFAENAKKVGEGSERGIETVLLKMEQLIEAVACGQLTHSLNIAAIFLGITQGRFVFPGPTKNP